MNTLQSKLHSLTNLYAGQQLFYEVYEKSKHLTNKPMLLISNDTHLLGVQFIHSNITKILKKMSQIKNHVSEPIYSVKLFLDQYFINNKINLQIAPQTVYQPKIINTFHITCLTQNRRKITQFILAYDNITDKQQTIYKNLLSIQFGTTISYGNLALISGMPHAARFTGTTMAKNIFAIIVPCHRVIKSNGALGHYTGGNEIKKILLEHEIER